MGAAIEFARGVARRVYGATFAVHDEALRRCEHDAWFNSMDPKRKQVAYLAKLDEVRREKDSGR